MSAVLVIAVLVIVFNWNLDSCGLSVDVIYSVMWLEEGVRFVNPNTVEIVIQY